MSGLLAPQFQSEEAAREHLEKQRWADGVVCPHCGVIGNAGKLEKNIAGNRDGKLVDFSTHARKGTWKCYDCREQFTVTVGTIFEKSKIPLHKWLVAIHLMCSSKKGVSALQLQRNLDLGSYRTAWFLAHRVRWAMTQSPMTELLKGVVEVDETYVGGREKRPGKPGIDSKKTPVVTLVERGGNVRSFPIQQATLKNIGPIMKEHIDPETHVVTDQASVYHMLKSEFAKHSTVNHQIKEYSRTEAGFKVTTNTVESFSALLKRSNYGIYHHWSRKYMGQYCAERDFVYNSRKMTDDERSKLMLKGVEGKRLMLKAPKQS
jgi:transposase-like protein